MYSKAAMTAAILLIISESAKKMFTIRIGMIKYKDDFVSTILTMCRIRSRLYPFSHAPYSNDKKYNHMYVNSRSQKLRARDY